MLKKLKNRKSQDSGFTIIEVLIVLAIAALILLIIFLAVPALQRNSRNTQRKEDAAGVLSGFNEFVTNNNGTPPDTCTGTATITFNTVAAGATTSESKVGYYNLGCVTAAPVKGKVYLATAGTTVLAGVFVDAAHDYVQVSAGTNCGANNAVVAGSSRQLTAVYALENTSGTAYAQACVAS